MTTVSSPAITLVSRREAADLAREPGVLALVGFGEARAAGDGRSPWLETGLQTLGDGEAPVQCWRVAGPVRFAQHGRFSVRAAPGLAMLATVVPDAADPAPAAEAAYREVLAAARELGCPHLLRIWQYLPRITAAFGDEDRYKRFCAGRRRAFERAGQTDTALPAACLLGDESASILIYALAAEAPGIQVENPRQISAFRYPPEYGRASPSFSRALAKRWPDGRAQLYISGTASVVGHRSLHTNTPAQLDEALRNLEALLAAGAERGGPPASGLASIAPLKVYLRRPADFPAVRDALSARLPAGHPVLYLRADVCRPDLLIEIEGVVA